ncbi:MAG: hypothetical protein HYZ29_01625, partial [Myxococcales bacterium]|nr:hypothetical protein [Myxococcales bacterium]
RGGAGGGGGSGAASGGTSASEDDGGCGCGVPRARVTGAWLGLLAALSLLARRARR